MEPVDEMIEEIRGEVEDIKSRLSADLGAAAAMASNQTVFKAHVQKGRRISIPKAEAESMDLEEGDLVQIIVQKIDKSQE